MARDMSFSLISYKWLLVYIYIFIFLKEDIAIVIFIFELSTVFGYEELNVFMDAGCFFFFLREMLFQILLGAQQSIQYINKVTSGYYHIAQCRVQRVTNASWSSEDTTIWYYYGIPSVSATILQIQWCSEPYFVFNAHSSREITVLECWKEKPFLMYQR